MGRAGLSGRWLRRGRRLWRRMMMMRGKMRMKGRLEEWWRFTGVSILIIRSTLDGFHANFSFSWRPFAFWVPDYMLMVFGTMVAFVVINA